MTSKITENEVVYVWFPRSVTKSLIIETYTSEGELGLDEFSFCLEEGRRETGFGIILLVDGGGDDPPGCSARIGLI